MTIRLRNVFTTITAALFIMSCGEGNHSSYTTVKGNTQLTSSSLASELSKKAQNYSTHVDSLGNGFETYYYITPGNMSGKILQAYLMVGKLGGDGPGGTALMLLAHGNGYNEPTVPSSNLLWDFNFKDPITWSTDFGCCGDHYPIDEDAKVTIVEMMFGYVDVEFYIAQGMLQGLHTLRIVYATIEDQGLKQGDILYKTDNGFAWWDSTKQTDGLTTARPATPIQNKFALKIGTPEVQRGNRYIQQLSAFVPDSLQLVLPADTVLNNTWTFEVDFLVSRCVSFYNQNPEQLTNLRDLMSIIDITANGFDIREMQGEKVGLAARVTATKAPKEIAD